MKLRRFNTAGIAAFQAELAALRNDQASDIAASLLTDESLSVEVDPSIEIEPRSFANRREAAKYLRTILQPLDDTMVMFDAGLWTWLTMFYFDQVTKSKDGKRVVYNDYYYIYAPRNVRHSYRHLLYIAWRVISIAPNHNRLFLDVPANSLDKATSEVMKRLYLTRIKCIFEVLDRIYWNPATNRIRSGVVSPGRVAPGDLFHRFPIRIRQLEMTYDLQSLNANQLIELLGEEFTFDKQLAKN